MDNSTANMKWVWTGRGLSTICMLPFVMGIVMNLTHNPEVSKGMAKMGLPESLTWPLVTLELVCVVLYAFPQTAVLGAILFAGYMGGAILTHLRIGEPVYIQTLIGILIWLGLWLREPRLRTILPFRR